MNNLTVNEMLNLVFNALMDISPDETWNITKQQNITNATTNVVDYRYKVNVNSFNGCYVQITFTDYNFNSIKGNTHRSEIIIPKSIFIIPDALTTIISALILSCRYNKVC